MIRDDVWKLVLAVSRARRSGVSGPLCFLLGPDGTVRTGAPGTLPGQGTLGIEVHAPAQWRASDMITCEGADLLPLYVDLAAADLSRGFIIAHLGQTLDGRIATLCGHSKTINGPENLCHLHRLRALSDAILVGAGTVAADDPQLTTRRVEGESPVRVILDPSLRLGPGYRVFQDREAPTLVVASASAGSSWAPLPDHVERLYLETREGRLDPLAIRAALAKRGLKRLFLEGGGVTVSRWLEAGALERLQITVAPVVLGSGRPSITLPPIREIAEGLRPETSTHRLGADVLFDMKLA